MVRIDLVYRIVRALSNKDLAGNTLNIQQFNDFAYLANYDVIKTKYGLPEEYQPGQPMPRVSYEITQKITDDLSFLKKRLGIDATPINIDKFGRADLPTDYFHLSSCFYQGRKVSQLTEMEVSDRRACTITQPTDRDPVMSIYSNYFQFYPQNLNGANMELVYLRKPKDPIYNSTLDPDTDEEIFDETNSVHFELPDDCLHDLVRQILGYVGVPLKDEVLIQYSERMKQTGK